MNNYQFEANVELVNEMMMPIISSLEEINVDHKKVYQINLALEELLVNIAKYAYSPGTGIIDISYDISDNPKQLQVIIKDKGKEFNPLEKEEPDLTASVKERKIGGLGIYIAKNIVDDITYQRINNEKIIKIIKNL